MHRRVLQTLLLSCWDGCGRKSLIITVWFPTPRRDWPCLRWRHLTLRLPLLSPFPRCPFCMQSIDISFSFVGAVRWGSVGGGGWGGGLLLQIYNGKCRRAGVAVKISANHRDVYVWLQRREDNDDDDDAPLHHLLSPPPLVLFTVLNNRYSVCMPTKLISMFDMVIVSKVAQLHAN